VQALIQLDDLGICSSFIIKRCKLVNKVVAAMAPEAGYESAANAADLLIAVI
jgi:hypothetical protein